MASMFEAVFNLYRTIPCYRYCGLFSIRSNFRRLCVEIHNYNSDSCNFIITYANDMSGPAKDKILVGVGRGLDSKRIHFIPIC